MRFRLVALASAAALVAVSIVTAATATTMVVPKLHGTIGARFHDLAQERPRQEGHDS